MRTFLFILSSCVAVLVLLLHDSRQQPTVPSFSYARQGLDLVAAAGTNPEKLQEAVDTLYEALRMDKRDPLALFGMGWALQLRGFNDEARNYYLQARAQIDELKQFTEHNISLLTPQVPVTQGLIPSPPVLPEKDSTSINSP